ncbi:MAG TPA: hypothetical protein VLX28_13770 [Thermoanaerobaculia bacterium]|nr:hypothetical protein [Thermoanaerobaculia bacterium]
MRTYFALIMAGLICLAGPVLGQQGTGDTELQFQGSLTVGGSGDDNGTVNVQLGRFFTDYQEIGITGIGSFQSDGKFGGFGGPYYRYNFSTGNVVPYLGVSAGSTFGTFSSAGTTTIASGEGGARFFLDRKTAFTVSATKLYFFKQKEFDKGLTIQFGFSHLWGK